MSAKTFLLAAALVIGMCVISTGKPTKAFCRVVWLFGLPCPEINMAIVAQIKSMVQYGLVSAAPELISAVHTSLDGLQIQNINFTLINMVDTELTAGCRVSGLSISAPWFGLMDNGTNYCNLYNVIAGSGLTSTPGYIEYTNEWICLGYLLAPCKV